MLDFIGLVITAGRACRWETSPRRCRRQRPTAFAFAAIGAGWADQPILALVVDAVRAANAHAVISTDRLRHIQLCARNGLELSPDSCINLASRNSKVGQRLIVKRLQVLHSCTTFEL